jgi:hypothetical protein
MDQQAIYMEMYKECCNQGRHHETQRSAMTTVCFGFASAALAYIAKSNGPSRDMLGLSVFLTILGLVAALLTYKQYERFRLAMDRAEQFRNAIDQLPPTPPTALVQAGSAPLTPSIKLLKGYGDSTHTKNYRYTEKLRLHTVWSVLFLLVAATGGWFTFLALSSSAHS